MADSKAQRRAPSPPSNPIAAALASCRAAFIGTGLVSGIINLLMLTGTIFMMQIYDRVLGSGSVPTLIALSLIAASAYVFQGCLDILRTRVLTLIGERVDAEIGPMVHAAVVELPLRTQLSNHEPLQPFRHLDALRSFLAGTGPVALFDMPWMPVYLVLCFLLHPWLGGLTLLGTVVLGLLTVLTEVKSKAPARAAMEAQAARNAAADAAQRASEVVRALGMLPALAARWERAHKRYLMAQRQANYVVGGFSATSRMFRFVLQSSLLGMGSYLAIRGQISSGAIVAASILGARALAPLDQAIGSWRASLAARQGYRRLKSLLASSPDRQRPFHLPAPVQTLVVRGATVAAPGAAKPAVRHLSLELRAGQALAVVGPSGSGKSTLARALVGVWPAQAGKVTLDGASLEQWTPEVLGPSLGYLPQDVQLFDGTVAENIARFSAEPDPEAVIAAARAAGVHEQVLALPDGYNTRIGPGGAQLSTGQRQRLGLARALYRGPFLVVLDEPNAHLDAEGEAAVGAALAALKARGAISVVITHRPGVIAVVDLILVMKDGEAVAFGRKEEILAAQPPNVRHVPARPPVRSSGLALVPAVEHGAP